MIFASLLRGLKTLIGCVVLAGMLPANAQSPQEHWRIVRDAADPTTGVTGIRATNDGHLIAVGSLGTGGISVSKLRLADGSTVWRSELALARPTAFGSVRDFAVDPAGNAYVIGVHAKGSLIAKFLPTGKLGWKKTIKGTPRAITIDSQGNPAVFVMEGSPKAGVSSGVTKYSAAKGAALWKATVAPARRGKSSSPDVRELEFDTAGNLIVAMDWLDDIPSRCVKLEAAKGRLVWLRQFNASNGDSLGISEIAVAPDGDVVVAASRSVDMFYNRVLTAQVAAADGSDLWIDEQYTTGSVLYMGYDTSGCLDRIHSTSKLSDSQLVVSKSDGDSGGIIWRVQNPGAQPPSGSLISVDSGPNGEIALLTNGGREAWVHLLDGSGKVVWAGANKPQDLSLQVNVPYYAEKMNPKQIVALEDSVVMACSRTNFESKQQDFAKYGAALPGKLVIRTSTGAEWQDGTPYHLGDAPLTSYVYRSLIVQNAGQGDLVLSNFRIFDTRIISAYGGYEFQLEGNSAAQVLTPGSETRLQIRFDPKEAGHCTARLEMNTSDPGYPSISIPLSGRGMGAQQEFEDWAVQQGMPESISPDHAPHGDGVPLLFKYAFNLDPSRSDHQVMKRDSGVAGLPLVTFEKKPESNGEWFRIEYVQRKYAKIVYRMMRSNTVAGPYESIYFDQVNVTPINGDWERVVGWRKRSSGSPASEFVRIEVTFK